nr:MAG TPA_asm: hypothetical protein [Caudoviricetes sp.]
MHSLELYSIFLSLYVHISQYSHTSSLRCQFFLPCINILFPCLSLS